MALASSIGLRRDGAAPRITIHPASIMADPVVPAELISESLESYLSRHHRNGHVIYLAIVLTVVAGIAALPVVRVEVSTQAPGTVRPVIDTHEIQAPLAAPVSEVRVADNQAVREGDLLVELRAEAIDAQLLPVNARIRELRRLAGDLDRLLRRDVLSSDPAAALSPSEVGQEYMQYIRESEEVAAALGQSEARLSRLERLYEKRHVAFEAVEGARFDVAELRAHRGLIREQYLTRWERARDSYRTELRELVARREQLIEQRELYSIRAPITGTVGQLASVSPGSFLAAGQRLMVISPLADLVAEVYVESRDIAYVRPGMRVRIQVDAFDYDRWGAIDARVLDVSDDAVLLDQTPVYRVRCSLGAARLRSPDGRVGALQKGMALQARFSLGRRSLLDLLRDDVRRWLDPYSPPTDAPAPSQPPPAGGRR